MGIASAYLPAGRRGNAVRKKDPASRSETGFRPACAELVAVAVAVVRAIVGVAVAVAVAIVAIAIIVRRSSGRREHGAERSNGREGQNGLADHWVSLLFEGCVPHILLHQSSRGPNRFMSGFGLCKSSRARRNSVAGA